MDIRFGPTKFCLSKTLFCMVFHESCFSNMHHICQNEKNALLPHAASKVEKLCCQRTSGKKENAKCNAHQNHQKIFETSVFGESKCTCCQWMSWANMTTSFGICKPNVVFFMLRERKDDSEFFVYFSRETSPVQAWATTNTATFMATFCSLFDLVCAPVELQECLESHDLSLNSHDWQLSQWKEWFFCFFPQCAFALLSQWGQVGLRSVDSEFAGEMFTDERSRMCHGTFGQNGKNYHKTVWQCTPNLFVMTSHWRHLILVDNWRKTLHSNIRETTVWTVIKTNRKCMFGLSESLEHFSRLLKLISAPAEIIAQSSTDRKSVV